MNGGIIGLDGTNFESLTRDYGPEEALKALEEQLENTLTETAKMLGLDMNVNFVLSQLSFSFLTAPDVNRAIKSIKHDHPNVDMPQNSDKYNSLREAFDLYKSLRAQIIGLKITETGNDLINGILGNNNEGDDYSDHFLGRADEGSNGFT